MLHQKLHVGPHMRAVWARMRRERVSWVYHMTTLAMTTCLRAIRAFGACSTH